MKTASSFCAFLTVLAAFGALAQPAPAPAPVAVVDSFFGSNVLPPANGAYVSPAQFHAAYANGVIIRNPRHHFFTRSLPPPATGTQIHTFGSTVEFEESMDGGQTFNKVSAPAQVSVSVTFKDSTGGSNTFNTEMLQLDISGGSLPSGVMIRESPTLQSMGQTTVRPVPGGYMIGSFFDIFTELSMDGGQTWLPAVQSAHVDLRIDPTVIGAIPVGSTLLPPPDGQYVTPEAFHAAYAAGVVIHNIRHRFFTQYEPPPLPGKTNIHTFDSQIDMQFSTDSGKTFRPVRAPASVSVQVSNAGSTGPDGVYDTEMLALDLQGGDLPTGVMVRESPTLHSRGGMTIQTEADGTFQVSSFFDIFTELSMDGGKTWQPSTSAPAHVELERASAVLLFPTSNLPPSDGEYVSPQKWHALYAGGIILSNVSQKRFTHTQPPATGLETFGSSVDMQISTDGGQTFNTYWAPAAVTVQLTAAAVGGNTQYYDTEMLALDIHGGTLPAGVMIRESPTKASLGRTSLMPDEANGGYRIGSFFDVFTELSLDGGQTWNAALTEPSTVSLVNQPPFAPFVVHCPSDITVFNGSPSGAVVNYSLPPILFYPDCPFGPFDATCVPPSGSYFPLGTTTVTCSGHDGCGETPSCTFQVTVLETVIVAHPWFFKQPLLPPPNGVFVSPGQSNTFYADGNIVIRNVRHRAFTGGGQGPVFGASSTTTFGSEVNLELSMDGGQTFRPVHAMADGSVRITSSGGTEILRTFDTEMLQLDISGGTLPPGVMLRESPSRQSIGRTSLQLGQGGFMVSSFFDVFTEISLDGGQSWSPSTQPTPVELHSDPAAVAPIAVASPLLPLPDGEYVTPAQFHAAYAAAGSPGIVISDIRHRFFTQSFPPPPPGGDQMDTFNSQVDMMLSTDGGQTFRPARAPAAVSVHVINLGSSGEEGLFETEMVALSLQGGDLPTGVVIRESPTLPSRGGVRIQKQADGMFQMNSFFDIFTELSMDGGKSWQPSSTGPAHVELQKSVTPHSFTTGNLPPSTGQYITPAQSEIVYVSSTLPPVIISNVINLAFTASIPPPGPGLTQTQQFNSQFAMVISLNGGQTWTRLTAPATEMVRVSSLVDSGNTRYFDTEMLALSIQGGGLPQGVMIRESPTKASLGRVTRTLDPATGQFRIDSFFDIFTELSLNGGQTWNAAVTGPSVVGLTPAQLGAYTINCPGDMTVNATSVSGAAVDFLVLIPLFPDCPFGPYTYSCTPPAGSVFPLGTTTVNCVGSDGCGEHPTCSFKVTVRQPFTFSGVVNSALGKAVLAPVVSSAGGPPSSMTVSNLSQSGADGFRIDAAGADGVLVNFQPFPVDVQTCAVSRAFSPLDDLLSVATFFGGSNPIVKADFSALGSVDSLVQVMDEHHKLIYSSRIENEAAVSINQFFPNPCPNGPSFYTIYQDYINVWVRFCRAGCDCSGTNCFTERIICISGIQLDLSIVSNLGYLEIRSQGVNSPSSLTVLNEQLMEFGNTHLAKGQATLTVDAAARRLPVNNLGSSGQDGVSIDLTRGGVNPGGSSQFDMSLDPVTLHNPGVCWKMTAFGEFNGTANTELGMASLTAGVGPEGGCEVRADFSAIGSSLVRVDLYQGPELTGSTTLAAGVLGTLFEQGNLIACGKLPTPFPCFYARFDGGFFFQGADGSQFFGTEIRILAANPAGQVQNITSFCVQACNLSSFTITGEQTPQPIEIDDFDYSLAQITLALPSGATETVVLSGPATVEVAIGAGGQTGDSDGNGLDDATTRMTKLDLKGMSSMGFVHVTLDPNRPSLGRIEETSNLVPGVLEVPPFAPGTADSFFDVFFQIQIGGPTGPTYFPAKPARMQTVIHHKPPGPRDNYVNPFNQPIDLVDANGALTGIRILREVHTPNPPKEIDHMTYGLAQLTLSKPGGVTEVVTLGGPTTVEVTIPPDGLAADPDGNGHDQAPSRMTSLELQGNSSMGLMRVMLDPDHPSLGLIEERVNSTPGLLDIPPFCATGTADSFFDVFALIEVGGQIYHPATPLHMQAVITHKPPGTGDTYTNPFTKPVDLLDANGNPTGIQVLREVHTPNPPVEVDKFPHTEADITVQLPSGASEVIHVTGPTTVNVTIAPDGTGVADTDANGLEDVPTVMTQLDLDGMSSIGPVHVSLDPNRPTIGRIEEQVNNTPGKLDVPPFTAAGSANSFFDVFFEVQINGLVLHNATAAHMQAVIHHKPPAPGDTYVNPFTQPIDLLDDNGNPTGIRMLREVHTPTPLPVKIACSADLTATTVNPAGAVVTYTVTASGGCTPPTVVCNPPSGSTFPVGTNVVTCVASDICGSSATCSFKVTVLLETLEIDQFSYSQGKINLQYPDGRIERVIVAGPTTVEVFFEGGIAGAANDSDGNGLDDVATLMTQLMLNGNSTMGAVSIMLDPANPTKGQIEEEVNTIPGVLDLDPFGAKGCARSYFDVYALIKVGGLILHPAVPLHIEARICHKPPGPGEAYMNLTTQPPIDLLDANGNPTGIKITSEMHTPNPPVERDYFSYSQGKINLQYPDGRIERVIVAGPTKVEVGLDDSTGFAADTDGNGLDDVPTTMTLLNLLGNSTMGAVNVMLDPAHVTSGKIEEEVNTNPGVLDLDPFGAKGCAQSYFDVYALIKVGGLVLHPAVPLHIVARICHKPPGPGEAYMNLVNQPPIDLLDANGNPTGIKITGEMHTPNIVKEIDSFPNSYAEITVTAGAQSEVVKLRGPTTVQVCIQPDGLAADPNGDGRDEVPTMMTQFDLTGLSALVGPVQVRLDAARPTVGAIEERVNNTPGTLDLPPFAAAGSADSYFDVFAEFLVAGQVFHTAQPLHMQSVITHKPPAPGETYTNQFTQPVPLLDANGNPTGVFITKEIHTPNPTNCVTITCPSDIVAWTCSTDGTKVSYVVNASNICGGNVTVSCKPASGGLFPVGMSTVTCTASDGFGSAASCNFSVKVIRDTTPPRLVCPNDIIIPACNGRELVSYTVTATDDCDPSPTVVCNPPSGSAFLPGTTPVTCIATDSCGNKASCGFLVVVVPPKMSFTTSVTGNTRQFQICWSTPCPGTLTPIPYRVQCAHGLGSSIQWENVTNAVVVSNGTNYCITVTFSSDGRFYRLVRYTPQEVFAPTNSLPPTGSFNSPSGEQTTFPNVPGLPKGIITRWFVHRVPPPNPPVPPPCLTCPDTNLTFSTTLDLQFSVDGGNTFSNASAPARTTVKVHPSGDVGQTRSFDIELISLDVAGGNLPLGAMLRESPTKQSLGRHTIRAIEGGYMISSFFDVFLEVSIGGGPFVPALASIHVDYNSAVAANAYSTDAFPPTGFFNSPSGVPTRYLNGLIARKFQYQIPKPPSPKPPPCLTCPPELFDFPAVMNFEVSTDGGGTYQPMTAQVSSTQVMARHSEDTADTRFFDTELLLFRVSPGPTLAGIMLRESPTLPSKGKTTVQTVPSPTGPGTYRIGSYFDVFTEVSLDNGTSWSSVVNPTHLELNPQPLPP